MMRSWKKANGWTTKLKRWTRAPYAQGHPELSLFATEEEREKALEAIETRMTPRTPRQVLSFLWAVVIFLSVPMLFGYLVGLVLLPPMGPWNDRIMITLGLTGYATFVYFAIWRDVPHALRVQALEAGIPVCLKCGYDLRGHVESDCHDLLGQVERHRCPECGADFDERLNAILDSRNG